MSNLTVIDFFCGAGGFSEGFRQQGFRILAGYDCWEPATKTFNHNFGLDCIAKNILDFQNSTDEIESLPDTDIILGSPPCVTFSSSNISGKADKALGITLTQVFLRIVAVKKWKKDSKLKAWFMENVPSSIKHLGHEYTFEDLGLAAWAKKNKIGKSKIAIKLNGNQHIINSADYGSVQSRVRVISGEIIKEKKLVIPSPSYSQTSSINTHLPQWRSVIEIKKTLPKPNTLKSNKNVKDPNYPWITLRLDNLSDHFYDTGLYKCEWKQSKFLKTNHPYMGKMAFPENDNKPSRTITATKIGTSRESIIYKSEYNRCGDGEYRTPTVREAACIMGFPITYQFLGGETTKWRLVGNAVCPSISSALAKQVRKSLKLKKIKRLILQREPRVIETNNLNTFKPKEFATPPKRNIGSRFRRHPFKDGNMTVTLSNYDIDQNEKKPSKWITSIQYGNGEGFPTFNVPNGYYLEIEPLIEEFEKGRDFIKIINNGFSSRIASQDILQRMYEQQKSQEPFLEPTELVEQIASIIENLELEQEFFSQKDKVIFEEKDFVPVKQLLALYAINKISTVADENYFI